MRCDVSCKYYPMCWYIKECMGDIGDDCDQYKPERPRGEWKVDNKIYCSECGESICDFIPNPTDAVGLILSNNFCLNCGADMRKEGEAE